MYVHTYTWSPAPTIMLTTRLDNKQRLEAEEDSWLPARKAALIASGDDLGDIFHSVGLHEKLLAGRGFGKKKVE